MPKPNDIGSIEAQVTALLRHTCDLPPEGREALVAILDYFQINLDRAIERLNQGKPDKALAQSVHTAAEELSEAVKETAQATDDISTATNKLEQLARRADGNLAGDLARACSTIYDACAYQEIAGQRINKVKGTLTQVDALFSSLGTRTAAPTKDA